MIISANGLVEGAIRRAFPQYGKSLDSVVIWSAELTIARVVHGEVCTCDHEDEDAEMVAAADVTVLISALDGETGPTAAQIMIPISEFVSGEAVERLKNISDTVTARDTLRSMPDLEESMQSILEEFGDD